MKALCPAFAMVVVLLTNSCASSDRPSVVESKSSSPTPAVAGVTPAAREVAPTQSDVSVDTTTIPESAWLSEFEIEASPANGESVPLPDLHKIPRRSVVYRNAYAPAQLTAPVRPRARTVPAYPYALRVNSIGGSMLLSLLVGPDGTVARTDVLKATNQLFAEAAVQAVAKWRFIAGQKNGTAVASVVIVPIWFHVRD